MTDSAKNWLQGKRGVVMGVANDRSIAWGMSKTAHEAGAELAFTYQGEALEKRIAVADQDNLARSARTTR